VCRPLIAFQTLDAFLKEAGLPPDAGATASADWTVEKLLEEKRQYDASMVYEKVSEEEKGRKWSLPGEDNGRSLASELEMTSLVVVPIMLYARVIRKSSPRHTNPISWRDFSA
jgi:hypothetical protein